MVSKSELIARLWPDTFVDEANLTQHIYTLRKVLGNQPTGKRYIETSARRGYRFAAAVREITTGEPVEAQSTKSAGPAIPQVSEGERKRATVLHSTLANAAAAVERLGAAGLHVVMRRLLEMATSEIERYEGLVSERHTEGLVAVFGASVVHEDDGRRAVLAALGIQRRFREINASDGEELDLRFGINTGPLIISRIVDNRRIEYAAVGQTTQMADLLQQFARPGDILVSETTRQAVERDVALEPVVLPLSAATPAYRVIGITRQSVILRMTRALAPFVGRQPEMALLDRLYATASVGSGQFVGVVGEPGMGKSRLMYEFARTLGSRAEPPMVLEGRCARSLQDPLRARHELDEAARAFHALGEEFYCARATKSAASLG